jgi:hypothetical protein
MVELTACVSEIGLTKQKGTLRFLDGNKVYFTMESRGEHGKVETHYYVMDISVSRKKTDELELSAFPKQPTKRKPNVYKQQILYNVWRAYYLGVEGSEKDKTVMLSHDPVTGKQWLTTVNAEKIIDQVYSCKDREICASWHMTEEVKKTAEAIITQITLDQERKCEEEYHPYRKFTEEETAMVAGILSFDGDKKSLVTGLKSSLDVAIKDSDVSVDKLFTGKITGIVLEELIK